MGTSSKNTIEAKRISAGQHRVVDKLMEERTDKEIGELFERARQTVKPIILEEASNEIVSEDILNFKMD
ncbi:hypothetical protein [Candidatus Rariloculus sp.]|uniref:hypothetical protein n=1 Tax=Candidatus Rariloculus sp. TaxID=3101265 RepID=UPI003D1132F4